MKKKVVTKVMAFSLAAVMASTALLDVLLDLLVIRMTRMRWEEKRGD